ncbi:MAG: Gfo/Idh/MocA family oxidoreductase [Lentisphaerae bacterium]|nr:Gfo/Idh/MocA family oxidoreductase [Lentisphaerota bacterium]MBT4817651.1 Gfo/Idh/MocA family oxidoreductase [Lentisphaerota bacterium]MBT5612250.1 Gfo/Idh/MocA family oxidoreductase [Lentisphaerota bacterium]MBT7060772.1 Gfo/Idh/MocA family oxidoreductase [Lentisphaerota bacterium]MBT7845229.1 Gfo/Idh/MocA family oxidoreductase [Lentisphaerota bacterium]
MDKLRVGILGLRRGLSHLRNFLAVEDAEVIGVADQVEKWRNRAAEAIAPKTVKQVSEFEELLALKPDAVVIASNGRFQAQHAVQAMEAGCHVMSEVPGAYTQEEISHIILAAERYDRTYMLAENSCFLDFLRYWRKWLLDGRFGPVSIAEGEYLHYLPNSMVDGERNQFTPTQWREDNISGLSPLWRADQPPIQYLTHDLGPLLNVLDDRVVSVCCKDGPFWCAEAPLRSDGQIALFQTAKGSLIKIMVTLNTRRPGAHNYRLFGTLGSAEWYSHEGFCRRFDCDREHSQGWERINIGTAACEADKKAGHGGTDIKTAFYFTKSLIEGTHVPIDVFRMADFTLPGILAARSAELGGQPISVPDLRRGPFVGTNFWEHVQLPDHEPEGTDYTSDARVTH